jgi:hypothetical protein
MNLMLYATLQVLLSNYMEQSHPLEANSHSASEEIPFYEMQRFVAVFAKACHWTLIGARRIQSTSSHPISLTSFLILSYHVWLHLPNGLFLLGF